jgi:hypothetical protein
MRKILLSSAALVVMAMPAAAAQLNVGSGFTFGNVVTNAGVLSAGNAAAGSLSTGATQQIGTGFSVTGPGPIGTTTAGVGASVGQAGSVSGAAAIGNGAAITQGSSQVIGVGIGAGLKLP